MTSIRPSRDTPGVDMRLSSHLLAYLGAWPPAGEVDVVGWAGRRGRAWDGAQVPAVVVVSPVGTVISVPPEAEASARALATTVKAGSFRAALATAVGAPGRASPWLMLRWSSDPAPLRDAGVWLDADHPALPEWLNAFAGRVLAVLDDEGRYIAGVGIKPHTPWGHEVAVGTVEEARGRGLGRRLVAQAGRAVLDAGAVPLYVHDPANLASARVADAAGFPDLGWRLLVVSAP